MGRLPTRLVAAGLLRAAEAMGGNGVILSKGDPDAGALLLVLMRRGIVTTVLDRIFSHDGFAWNKLPISMKNNLSESVARLIAQKKRFDRDLWVLELDIPDVDQFIVDLSG